MDIYDPIAEALGVSPLSIIYDYSEYSLFPVGVPPWNKGMKMGPLSEEHKANLSVALKNKPSWNEGLKTGPLSEEHKANLSVAFKNKTYEEIYGADKAAEQRAKLKAAHEGVPLSPSHRDNMVAAIRAKYSDPDYINPNKGRPPANKGKPMSEEQRAKLREAWKKRKARDYPTG